jgi:hypothetical protein
MPSSLGSVPLRRRTSAISFGLVLAACSDRAIGNSHDDADSSASTSTSGSTNATTTSTTPPVDTSDADVDDGARPHFDLGARLDTVPPDLDCSDTPVLGQGRCSSTTIDDEHVWVVTCAAPDRGAECATADSGWARARIDECACFKQVPRPGSVCGPVIDELGECCYWYYDYWCPPPP